MTAHRLPIVGTRHKVRRWLSLPTLHSRKIFHYRKWNFNGTEFVFPTLFRQRSTEASHIQNQY